MSKRKQTVLLTGGSGVLGQALIENLTNTNVICIVHRAPVEALNVESVPGDICEPRLGLTREQFADLARRVDYVIHSAAATSFGDPREVTFRTNVDGTRHVLELAHDAGVPFCHISTAFAHLEGLDASHHSNAYEASKLEAEEVVRESGVPHVILKPSVVVGDSHDGRMSCFQGFHFLCELMLRGVMPMWVPAKPTALMDFVPQDAVSDVVAELIDRPDLRGEYWITSGERALQVQQAIALWEQHIPRLTGRSIKPPRYVDPEMIDRLLRPVFMPQLPARTQAMVNQALELLSFGIEKPLPTSLPELELTLGVPRMADPELVLIRNSEFWARKRGFDQAGGNNGASGRPVYD